jgi:hypothetical protein
LPSCLLGLPRAAASPRLLFANAAIAASTALDFTRRRGPQAG